MAMLGLAFSKVVPSAVRAVKAFPRVISGSISSVLSQQVKRQISPIFISHYYSTNATDDGEFVNIMKSETKCKHSLEKTIVVAPAEFPFRIEDEPCKKSITLRRVIDGENIDVVVMPIQERAKDDEESDVSDDDNSCSSDEENEEECRAELDLFVNITKENGKSFDIGVSASPNQIRIGSMSIKSTKSSDEIFGEYVVEQDSDLECGLREFVERRGIKKCYVGFLHDYMLNKSKRYNLLLLKKIKKFIED